MLKKLPECDNQWFWIPCVIIIKLSFFIFFFHNLDYFKDIHTDFTSWYPDSGRYINSIDQLFLTGEYKPDHRMPGYGAVYYLLRLIFPTIWARDFLILLQLLLASVATYVLALLIGKIFADKRYFLWVISLLLVSTYASVYDHALLTESFTTSALIFSIFFFFKYLNKQNNWNIFLTGFFIAWAGFMRPVYIPVIALYGIFIFKDFFHNRKFIFNSLRIKHFVLLCLPFVCFDAAWSLRNYYKYSEFIPLVRQLYKYNEFIPLARQLYGVGHNNGFTTLERFHQAWGGNIFYLEGLAHIEWFNYVKHEEPVPLDRISKIKFPDYIFTSVFNMDSLKSVKNHIDIYNDYSLPEAQRNFHNQIVIQKLQEYANSIKNEKPFLYYVIAPIKYVGYTFWSSGSYYLYPKSFDDLTTTQKLIKLFYTFLYWISIVGGIVGIIYILASVLKKNLIIFLLAIISAYSILVHPLIFRLSENRYLVPIYPFMISIAVILLIESSKKWKKFKLFAAK